MGASRAPFGWGTHLGLGSIPLAAISVETRDSMEGGGAIDCWAYQVKKEEEEQINVVLLVMKN
jgi:hypothetical protein